MSEQLCIKRRSQHRHAGAIVAVALQCFGCNVSKMASVVAGALLRNRGIIWLLLTQINFRPGNAPITVSTGPALFVEFQIIRVARITMLTAPYLNSSARIAGKKRHLRTAWI